MACKLAGNTGTKWASSSSLASCFFHAASTFKSSTSSANSANIGAAKGLMRMPSLLLESDKACKSCKRFLKASVNAKKLFSPNAIKRPSVFAANCNSSRNAKTLPSSSCNSPPATNQSPCFLMDNWSWLVWRCDFILKRSPSGHTNCTGAPISPDNCAC